MLGVVEKLSDDAASEKFTATEAVSGTTGFDRALLLSADEHDILLYNEITAAHIRGLKLNAACNGRDFYSNAALLFPELSSIHSTECSCIY